MKSFIYIVAVTVLAACAQDPFAGESFVKEKPIPPTTTQQGPVESNLYVIDVPQTMDFEEGKEAQYKIRVEVPSPGKPVIDFVGLPLGAKFDYATNQIKWTPDYTQANDKEDPSIVRRTYVAKLRLSSTDTPQAINERDVYLNVKDTARNFDANIPSGDRLDEGVPFSKTFTITCDDFPTGKFFISSENLPLDAIKQSSANPSQFTISYTPTFADANVNTVPIGGGILVKRIPAVIHISGPRGHIAKSYTLTIFDKRQKPVIAAPAELRQGLDVSFTVTSFDPNGETAPTLQMLYPPAYGKFTVTPVPTTGFTSAFSVRWTDIPPDKLGLKEQLKIKSCVYDAQKGKNNCEVANLDVVFDTAAHKLPVIDRNKWLASEMKSLKVGSPLNIALPIYDGDNPALKVKVDIQPAEIAKEVTWTQGTLKINPQTIGERFFFISVSSIYGLVTTEAFHMNVIPANWSSTLVLADSVIAPEIKKTMALFPGGQLVNPGMQTLDKILLAERNQLAITTSALALPGDVLASISTATQNVHSVAIMTPLAGLLSGELAAELKELGVILVGRYSAQTGAPALSASEVLPEGGSGLSAPGKVVKLDESLTAESKDPLVLDLDANSKCTRALRLHNSAGTKDYTVAVSCKRKSGGKLLLTGFEWASLVFDASEANLGTTWFSTVVK